MLLDDGTGTWPHDVSPFFDRKAGLTISRGREDEFAQIDAATLALQLVNDDGRFTLGRTESYEWTGTPNASASVRKVAGVEVRRNLCPNPAPASAAGWFLSNAGAGGAGTVTYDAAEQAVCFTVTTAATNSQYTTRYGSGGSRVAVTPGKPYAVRVRVKSSVNDARTTFLDFYNAAGTQVAVIAGPRVALPAGEWVELTMTGVAPAGAASASFGGVWQGESGGPLAVIRPLGAKLWIREVLLEQATEPGAYFDGNTPAFNVFVRQPIRVEVKKPSGTWVPRFTGFVNSWPMRWTSGVAKGSRVQVSAADAMARLTKRKLTASHAYIAEVSSDRPAAFWSMQEPATATAAADVTGRGVNGPSPLAVTSDGAPPDFGVSMASGLTGVSFTPGQRLEAANLDIGQVRTLEAVLLIPANPALWSVLLTLSSFAVLAINSDGRLQDSFSNIWTPSSIADGLPHHVAYVVNGATTTLYLDGSPVGTGASQSGQSNPPDYLAVESMDLTPAMLLATVAGVAVHNGALSAARIADHAAALLTGFAGERSDERIARLYRYAALTSGITVETGSQSVGPLGDLSSVSPIDAMRTISDAEQGLLFFDGAGTLQFHARTHRYSVAPEVTIAAESLDPDTEFAGDDQGLINRATITRDGETASPQTVTDQASIDAYDESPWDTSLPVTTDEDAMQIAAWAVAVHAQPQPRTPSLKLDLLTRPDAFVNSILDVEIGDKVVITGLPDQAPAPSLELFVEGWTETISLGEWLIDANTSPAGPYDVWTIEDPVYGAYDSNPLAL